MKKAVFTEETVLTKGMKGVPVMILQFVLLLLGINEDKLKADGDYGDETEAALKEFKEQSGVKGIQEEEGFGPLTLKALKEEENIDLTVMSYDEEQAATKENQEVPEVPVEETTAETEETPEVPAEETVAEIQDEVPAAEEVPEPVDPEQVEEEIK